MTSQIGRAGFYLGFYVVFVSGILLLFLEHGTAEHSITLLTFLIGLVFLTILVILIRLHQRDL
jgi:hypothetical protein